MNFAEEKFTEMTGELLSLLDEEIRLLHVRIEQFDRLSESILSRDNEGMETLLCEMTDTQQAQTKLDTQLKALRAMFARESGMGHREVKLATIAERIDGAEGMKIQHRREQIVLLAETLKRKHLDAAVLLSESARLNRMLLEGLLPPSTTGQVTTYGRGGATPWRGSSGLVDAEM